MSDIGPINHSRAAMGPLAARRAAAQKAYEQPEPARGDRVQFSQAARLLSKLHELPDVRQELIDKAKANVEAGVYDRDEVLDATIDRMAEDF
jgi:hypothetical protein